MPEHATISAKGPVLVVGGAGAIGSAIVACLQRRDRSVIVFDREEPAPGHGFFYPVDITCDASVDKAMGQLVNRFGVPETLICAAGYLASGSIMSVDRADIQTHLDVNLFGTFNVAQRVARLMMPHGGKILFVSSIHGQIGVPNRGAYAISKAALGALARAMAVELSPHKIRVNVLAPGAVDGGMTPDPGARSCWQSDTPAGRVAEVEEIARFADVLTSDEASFLTGQTIALDGGASNLRPHGLQSDAPIS